MEKRVMLATFLSMLVILIFWQNWKQSTPPPVKEQAVKSVYTGVSAVKKTSEETLPVPDKNVEITTPSSRIILSTKGGAVLDWREREKNGQWAVIFSTETSSGESSFRLRTNREPYLENILYSTGAERITVGPQETKKVTFRTTLQNGLEITRIYHFVGQGYEHRAEVRFRNTGERAIGVPEYHLLWGPGLNPLREKMDTSTASALFNGKVQKKLNPGIQTGDISWVALNSTYFLVSFIPENTSFDGVITERTKDKRTAAGFLQKDFIIEPGETKTKTLRLYIGPKSFTALKTVAPRLEEIVGFGSIGKIFYMVLTAIYGVVKNYGWAIVILTLIIQIVLFPLTFKSYKSMKEMQTLQPLIKSIQEKYKDDPKRFNTEVMNLYRSHKVNPFGGCLPMLLQLPVFFALYNTIRYAVELRQSPFMFWIRDLSMPDTVFAIGGININILPLLMGVVMFVQQKMSSVDPQQAKMFLFMPVLFTVMFWNFPSGLVLYWFVNSLVSFAGQYFIINKQIHRQSPVVIDVKREK